MTPIEAEPPKYVTLADVNTLKQRKPSVTIPRLFKDREQTLLESLEEVKTLIKFWEGYKEEPYIDTEGYLTIGHGLKLSNRKDLTPDDVVITMSEEIADRYLEESILNIHDKLLISLGYIYPYLPTFKQMILISMAHQMGVGGVLKFRTMWKHLNNGENKLARDAARESLWMTQTKDRCLHHSYILGKEND